MVVDEVRQAFRLLDETIGRPGLPGLCTLGRM